MFTWEVNTNGNKNDATNVLSEIKLYWTFHKTLTYCFCFVLHHGISTEGTDLSELEATVQSSWNWTLGSRWDRLKNGDSSAVYNNELPLLTPLEFATFATARGRWLMSKDYIWCKYYRFHHTFPVEWSLFCITGYQKCYV